MKVTETATDNTRAAILGNRTTPAEIANSFGCCERVIVNVINEMHVPYIKFLGRRYVEPENVKEALLSRERNREARRPGRPAKRAA